MKKIYTLLFAAMLAGPALAQEQAFFTPTTYLGAFNANDDWTAGWANWDPQNTAYPAVTRTVNANITTNQTWGANEVIRLSGFVFVTEGATLTIEPGCIIRSGGTAEADRRASLIITRGARIVANGTAERPIVFTSLSNVGQRRVGDWGGVIILGRARNNRQGGESIIEGGLAPQNLATHGGNNDDDNSGIFRYVRIEYGGAQFSADNEINGLTMGSVGRATQLDHVQVSFVDDDAFEWFGGTVNAKYLISYRNVDDDFDCDFGYRGHVQYGLIVRDPALYDASSGSTSEGFEIDNDGTGTEAEPRTAPVFSNITNVGPRRGGSAAVNSNFVRGARLRRASAPSIFNSVFTDWPNGLHIDGTASIAQANAGNLVITDMLMANMGNFYSPGADNQPSPTQAALAGPIADGRIRTQASTNGIFRTTPVGNTPASFTAPDFRLAENSPALTGANFTHPKLQVTVTSIRGAISTTKLALYPNPASDVATLNIDLKKSDNVSVQLFDLAGRLVKTVNEGRLNAGESIGINTADLKGGVYVVNVKTSEGSASMKLFVTK
jgi:hypothetical protein